MRFINATKSLCPKCLKVIDARVIEKDNKVYINKVCHDHGHFETVHPWADQFYYKVMEGLFKNHLPKAQPDGLVINLTSECNQNCPFCFARANEYGMKGPSLDEIREKISGFSGSIIYLSGGEPTLRSDLFDIIREVKRLGYKAALFSNGKKLRDIEFVNKLKESGIDLVILQFDTFNEHQCEMLRGERLVATKLKAIENLKQTRIPIYLFVMLLKGVNTDQIEKLIRFTAQNSRFIKILNFNPVWEMGRVGEHEPMNMSDIFVEVEKKSGLGAKNFIDGTVFSYYIFTIYKKLTGKGGNKHPWCEMRCYIISDMGKLTVLGQLINIKMFNVYLKRINDRLDEDPNFNKLRLLVYLPYHFLIWEFLTRKKFRQLIFHIVKCFLNSLFGERKPILMQLNMFSIIIGTFHTASNIDLNLVDTCNLYSDFPNGEHQSSCLRQIAVTRQIEASLKSIHKFNRQD